MSVITADEGLRGGRKVPLKKNVDAACKIAGVMDSLESVLVVRNTGGDVGWQDGRDYWYHEEADTVADDCPAEEMNAEDPLFILYTSGSTGKAQGRAAHHRRLPRLRVLHARDRFRLPRRRHLLVHRRRRLGDRPQLHRLRPAGQRRDHDDVRRRAQLPEPQPFLGGL